MNVRPETDDGGDTRALQLPMDQATRQTICLWQPQRVFQIASLMACIGIFVAHLDERASAEAPLTMGNQDLIGGLIAALAADPAWASGAALTAFLFVVFGTALLLVSGAWLRSGTAKGLLASLQLLIGLLVNNDLLLILAAQFPIVYRTRVALLWLVLQSVAMVLVWSGVLIASDFSNSVEVQSGLVTANEVRAQMTRNVVTSLMLFVAWQVFAFCLGYIAMSERVSRDRLTAANAQLLAAQQLLAESARSGERLRIARELHDALGHHLTALGLHLELAARQVPNSQAAAVHTARDIARELLAEVRAAVGRERTEAPVDLEQSLRTMCAGIPMLEVTLDCEARCAFSDPSLAHVAFRSVQEAFSNAMRHAEAQRLSVRLRSEDGGIRIEIKDDGRGTAEIRQGNGLRGLRERIEASGGKLDIRSEAGAGFTVSTWLPRQRGE